MVDIRRDSKSLVKAIRETGELFTKDGHKVYQAWQKALQSYRNYRVLLKNHLLPKEAIEALSGKKPPKIDSSSDRLKVALIGHNYNLNDSFSSFNLAERLREKDVFVFTPDALSERIIERMNRTMEKQIFWIHERKLLGSALFYIRKKMVDGIISVTSFNCGTSAVTNEFIGYEAEKAHIPLLSLVVDEHTAEAGVKTRIEAFINLMKWKYGGI
jgi:predicted nucleotide-binding protein (sugar kinase/HSP70/actin superfamily)